MGENIKKFLGRSEYQILVSRWLMQKQYNFRDPVLEKIELRVSLNTLSSLEDSTSLDVLSFLELVSGQKATVCSSDTRFVGSNKKFFASFLVTLRGELMYDFLEYFSLVSLSGSVKQQGVYLSNNWVHSNRLVININDWSCFYGLNRSLPGNLNICFYGDASSLRDVLSLNKVIFTQDSIS